MPTKRHCILHIGTEKTGSTSIQTVMAALRQQLPSHGFAYPRSPGARNHMRLSLYAGDPKKVWALARREDQAKGDSTGIGEILPDELERELGALPASVHTVIFSNEHCHSRLLDVESVQRLKTLLDRFFDTYHIVVYLRRQDELAVSRYSTIIRTGGINRDVLSKDLTTMLYFAYDKLLDRWGEVFGRASLRPRLFGREYFVEGDLIRDFYDVCGLPPLAIPVAEGARNPAIIPAAQEFMLRFNRVYHQSGVLDQAPWVSDVMNAEFAGQSRMPARAEAMRFCEAFKEINERVRAEFYPERAVLFTEKFDRYPEIPEPIPTDADVLEVALKVLARVSPFVERKGVQRAATEAAEAPQEKSIGTERTELLAKLDEEPTSSGALRRLLRIALDPADQEQALERLAVAQKLAPERTEFADLVAKLGGARRTGYARRLALRDGPSTKKKKRKGETDAA